MDVKVNFIALTIAILFFLMPCLLSLLIFWHFGKKDIKEYLNGKEK